MRVLLITTGSLGDFLPFIGIGKALCARGHDVILFGGEAYGHFARDAGIGFVSLLSAEDQERLFRKRWDGGAAVRLWIEGMLAAIEPTYAHIAEHYVPGQTVIVNLDWMFGARIAREALDCRQVTVHMQPSALQTKYTHTRWLPPWLMSLLLRLLNFVADLAFARPINRMRASRGLRPIKQIVGGWWNSPDLVIGSFPEWFAAKQRDWPKPTLLPGFALYEPSACLVLPDEVRAYLDAGDPPILFGQGSWVSDAHGYFRESIEAAKLLGRRAILLTPRREQLPAVLPQGIAHFSFIPHNLLLPRSAAFVHHAGTGSLAAGLAAGVPQLAVPKVGDQKDNARRLEQLGVSATITGNRYRARHVARKLDELLQSPVVRERCQFYRERMRVSTFEIVADAIERLIPGC